MVTAVVLGGTSWPGAVGFSRLTKNVWLPSTWLLLRMGTRI